ncbi:MAG: hypothetical protein AB2A00_19845 [Myxococcota bacterium]
MLLLLAFFLAGLADARAETETPTLAVLPLEAKLGVPPQAAELLTDNLLTEVRNTRIFGRVVGPQEIATLMPAEQQSFLIKCASDECALVDQELAGALGVSHLIVGNLGKLGSSYLINMRMLELKTSTVLATLSERVRGESPELLLDALRPSLTKLLVDSGFIKPQNAPAPAAAAIPGAPATTSTTAPESSTPSRLPILRAVGGVGLLVAAVPALGALALWTVVGAWTAYDFARGYKPGGQHQLTANEAFLSDVAFVGAALSSVVALVMVVAFSVALGASVVAS